MVRAARALQTRGNRYYFVTGMPRDAAFRCAVPRLMLGYPRCAFDSGTHHGPSAHGRVSPLKHDIKR